MSRSKANRQLSLHFDIPTAGEVRKGKTDTVPENNTVSFSSFRAEKSRQRLVEQLKRSGLLDLKRAKG